MSLRVQLLAVGVVTLVLPVTAVQFVRQVEDLLRDTVRKSVVASAATVAAGLSRQAGVRDAVSVATVPAGLAAQCATGGCASPGMTIYAQPLISRPTVDGHPDWVLDGGGLPLPGGHAVHAGLSRGARDVEELYLIIEVRDGERPQYQSGVAGRELSGDRIVLTTIDASGNPASLLLSTEGPGPFRARHTSAPEYAATGAFEERVRAQWDERTFPASAPSAPRESGYIVEVRVPLAAFPAHEWLGVAIIDVDALDASPAEPAAANPQGTQCSVERYRVCVSATWDIEALDPERPGSAIPGRLARRDPEVQRLLELYAADGRFRVVDGEGWVIAETGRATAADRATLSSTDPGTEPPGIVAELLGMALTTVEDLPRPAERPPGRAATPSVQFALAGAAEADWFAGSVEGNSTIVAAAPLRESLSEVPFGAVVLEQTSERILLVRDKVLASLLGVTLLATVVVAAFLLGYATRLSLRVRRLARAAENAVGPRGEIRTEMPGRNARDEVGDLARSFARLLERLREHTEYLKTLAGKLSHELRTPLAVVSTSLDNLEHETQTPGGAKYVARLREGTARLDAILIAMSEATRLEQAIADMPLERYDADAVLASCVRAYRDVYPEREIVYRSNVRRGELRGSPELLAQLLDKLVDNAVSFSEPGSRIDVTLDETRHELVLGVANRGPKLPEKMRARLFDSFVTVREQRDARPHMGLGLRIVALVAEFHGGRAEAENLPSGDGVVFRVWFPHKR